jgi:deoxyadenosine/deoxycytidine kinase
MSLRSSSDSLGTPSECRHRETVYQQLSAAIMREANDLTSLAQAAGRALGHPDVRKDGLLAGMVRSCVSLREAELRARMAEHQRAEAGANPQAPHGSPASATPVGWKTVMPVPAPAPKPVGPSKVQIVTSFERLRHEYDERLAHFELEKARHWLDKIEELHGSYPEYVSEATVQRCRIDFSRVEQKRRQLLEEIDQLAESATTAAGEGRTYDSATALKRLATLSASRPLVLPEVRLQEIRDRIAAAGEKFEHQEATRAMLEREKAIAVELRTLADSVHQFHLIARQMPHDADAYRQAEAEYRRTIRQLRWHDKDWLADLMLEMDEMLERLHDPTGRAEAHVSGFLASVRATLSHTVAEVREIASESTAGPSAPPS